MEAKILFNCKMSLGYRYMNGFNTPSCGGSLNSRNKIISSNPLYKRKLKISKKVCSYRYRKPI